MQRADRRGFTLIELVAGLALVGVVFAMMLLLVDALLDGRDRLLLQARYDNAGANGVELMRQLVARSEAEGDLDRRFAGSELSAQFRSWCDVPGGWLERCSVRLTVLRSEASPEDSSIVTAGLSTGEQVTLLRAAGVVRFRYFVTTPTQTAWFPMWNSSMVPVAMAIIAERDTLVLVAGGRG